VRRRRGAVGHEGAEEDGGGDLVREQLGGQGDAHAAEAVADEHDAVPGGERREEVQQRRRVVPERGHLAERPRVHARRRQVRRVHAVPRGAEPGGHLEPGPAAEARAVDEHDVLAAAAAHGEKGYGTVLLAARDVGSNARSPLVRLQQPRLGAEENL